MWFWPTGYFFFAARLEAPADPLGFFFLVLTSVFNALWAGVGFRGGEAGGGELRLATSVRVAVDAAAALAPRSIRGLAFFVTLGCTGCSTLASASRIFRSV